MHHSQPKKNGFAKQKAQRELEQKEKAAEKKVCKIITRTGVSPHQALKRFSGTAAFKCAVLHRVITAQAQAKREQSSQGLPTLAPTEDREI